MRYAFALSRLLDEARMEKPLACGSAHRDSACAQ